METGADAAWVGWGFVAEDPAFAELCERIGVTFIGPSAEAMRKLGDKIGAKLIAEEVGVPVAPWSRGAVETLDGRPGGGAEIGYPLMLKATAGGGGRGIRVVTHDAELADAYERTSEEAARAFGSGRRLPRAPGHRRPARRGAGDRRRPGHRVGARRARLLGAAPQPEGHRGVGLAGARPRAGAELKASAERLAVAVGYRAPAPSSSSTTPATSFFAFLEVNTRLQVEHPITEVDHRLRPGQGAAPRRLRRRLDGERPGEGGPRRRGPAQRRGPRPRLRPRAGRIARLDLPAGPGIRVDTGVGEGDSIPADFDSMIAKIIAYGRDRDEALGRCAGRWRDHRGHRGRRDEQELRPRPARPARGDRRQRRHRLDRPGPRRGRLVATEHSGVALVAAGIEAYEEAEAIERTGCWRPRTAGRPQVQHDVRPAVDLKLRGTAYKVTVFRTGPARFRVAVADRPGTA